MLMIRLDVKNPAYVEIPELPRDLLQLARRYLAYEEAQLPADQVTGPSLSVMQEATDNLHHWTNQAEDQEQARSVAASHYRATWQEAKTALRQALATIRLRFLHQLDRAEPWGVQVRQTKKGLSFKQPSTQEQWWQLWQDYIEQEGSLPARERLDDALYARLHELAELFVTYRTARDQAIAQRQVAVQNRNEAQTRLALLLQGAIFMICMLKLDGQLRQELEQWGFRLIQPSPDREKTSEEV